MERLLLECAIRSTFIVAAAAVVLLVMRIKNAGARHSTWTGVLVFSLALPLLVASGATVPLRILPPVLQNAEQVAPYSTGTTPFILLQTHPTLEESPRIDARRGSLVWPHWIEGIYILGVAVLLIRLVTGMIGAYRIRRQARLVDGRLTSVACSCPITVGFVHAVTILPEGWQDWEPAKLDAVLIHESQHARRYDPLVQWLALLNRAIFWFYPLAWWLERRLTTLSEEACDIVVLESGHNAGDYSRYLLDLARSVSDSRRRIRVLGMAMPGAYLPKRIQKILRGGLPPRVSFSRMVFASAVFFLSSVGLSTTTPVRAQNTKTTGIGAEITVQPPMSPVLLAMTPNTMPLQIGDNLRAIPGIKAVAPVMVKFNVTDGIEAIYGIDSHFTEVGGGFHWREGRLFSASDEIVVDDFWAGLHKVKPGDTVTLLGHQFNISGVVEHAQGARVFMSIGDLSQVTGQQSRAGLFFIKLKNPDQVHAVSEEIGRLLPGYTIRDVRAFTTSVLAAPSVTPLEPALSPMRLPQVLGPLIFEAASVKPTSPGSGITWGSCHGTDRARQSIASRILQGMSPPAPPALGRCLITRASLKQIVVEAYNLAPTVEITGGPGWFDSDRFDIDAKAEDPSRTTAAQLQQMLQQLLADRFKLKLHREEKEVSGSLLVVAGNAAKLKEAAASDGPPRGGRPGDMNFRGATMPILAEFLSQAMGRPVQDKTELTGQYTFNLKWALTETDSVQPEFVQPPDPSGPSLVTALQEQLGLRLQSAKVPVFMVVIDSAEKPLPN